MSLNVQLLESSFALVAPKADELADTFYQTLFSKYPAVKPLFKSVDMPAQKKNLVATLAFVVANLRNGDALQDAVAKLGLRHVGYGAQREHYPLVGQVLLETLAKVAGDAWNDELQQAWGDAYGAIQGIIFDALDQQEHKKAA